MKAFENDRLEAQELLASLEAANDHIHALQHDVKVGHLKVLDQPEPLVHQRLTNFFKPVRDAMIQSKEHESLDAPRSFADMTKQLFTLPATTKFLGISDTAKNDNSYAIAA